MSSPCTTSLLSMGNETLDGHLHEWFRVKEIPRSRFEFRDALIPCLDRDTWHGSLTLVGKTVDVRAQGRLMPAREGSPDEIIVSLEAKIRLAQPFGLRGPEGPFPENDTVIVHAEIPFTREERP